MLFPCPLCRQDVELGEKGLADCPRNLTLERIVERFAEKHKTTVEILLTLVTLVEKATNKDAPLNEIIYSSKTLNTIALDQLSCRKGVVAAVVRAGNGNPP